ncbi:MAG: toxin-antitoxin system TumE family protein [Acidobacteriaceae bacterium]
MIFGHVLAHLTTSSHVGTIANVKAVLITRFKDVAQDGGLIEMVVWRLPEPAPPCTHPFKYRLVYVVHGTRIIGFDNEQGKGDHRHVEGQEQSYAFAGIDRLIEDFIAEVERWKSAH